MGPLGEDGGDLCPGLTMAAARGTRTVAIRASRLIIYAYSAGQDSSGVVAAVISLQTRQAQRPGVLPKTVGVPMPRQIGIARTSGRRRPRYPHPRRVEKHSISRVSACSEHDIGVRALVSKRETESILWKNCLRTSHLV